jgi:hypothetical protein
MNPPDPDNKRAAIGQPFNPWTKACGFYPPDTVGRQRLLACADGRERAVTDGHKRLYERAVRWAGRNGSFWYSFETIARELGKSVRQVKSDMRSLEEFSLISHVRRGNRQSNQYQFLWHKIFESEVQPTACQAGGTEVQPTAHQDFGSEEQDTTSEVQSSVNFGRSEVQRTAHEFSPLNCIRGISSSSCARSKATAEVAEPSDDAPILSKEKRTEEPGAAFELSGIWGAGKDDPLMGNDPLSRWFLEAAAKKIHESKCGCADLTMHPPPDIGFAAKMIEPWRGKGTPALADWLLSASERRLGAKGKATGPYVYGLFLTDSQACAQTWAPKKPISKTAADVVDAQSICSGRPRGSGATQDPNADRGTSTLGGALSGNTRKQVPSPIHLAYREAV